MVYTEHSLKILTLNILDICCLTQSDNPPFESIKSTINPYFP